MTMPLSVIWLKSNPADGLLSKPSETRVKPAHGFPRDEGHLQSYQTCNHLLCVTTVHVCVLLVNLNNTLKTFSSKLCNTQRTLGYVNEPETITNYYATIIL